MFGEIVAELQFAPDWDKVNFQLNLPEGLIIRADETRLKMVFSNIISNSIKYRNKNIKKSWIKIQANVVSEQVEIEIEDNGIGIDKELHSRIFEMFFRANNQFSGSGLGLYIARETLTKLSGTITLNSIIGKGTTFTITLPHGM